MHSMWKSLKYDNIICPKVQFQLRFKFPPVLFDKIFKYLKDPNDVSNFILSHKFFIKKYYFPVVEFFLDKSAGYEPSTNEDIFVSSINHLIKDAFTIRNKPTIQKTKDKETSVQKTCKLL